MYKTISDQRIFMNTKVEFITWTETDRDKVHELFDKGFQQFHFVIDKFSRFKKDSELSKLNHSNGRKAKVSQELFSLIEFALDIADKTNGAYDPTVIDFLETYGYGAKYDFSRLKNKNLIKKEVAEILKTRPSFKDIKINKSSLIIKLAQNQKIDLGSIGKGYAIDRAFNELLPLENFLINAGGDIQAKGINKNNKPWLVGLKVPKFGQIGKIKLDDKAICCSGSWARKVKFFHHLINPKTGIPQNDIKATFILSKTAIEADAWSTALFVSGKNCKDLINKYRIKAVIVNDKNNIKKFGINLLNL